MSTVIHLSSTAKSPAGRRLRTAGVIAIFSLPFAAALLLSGGCGGDEKKTPADTLPAGSGPSGVAVLSSDYSVSSVSLYDPTTAKLVDGCVHTDATTVQPLSGDVTLPTQTAPGDEVVVIDRQNSVISFVNPATCVTRTQVSVSTGGFEANPHDFISISAHKAYVTRYNTNLAPSADPASFDGGDDLLVIDPLAIGATVTPISKRIALSSYATPIDGSTNRARPDRGVFAENKVYVTLGNMDADFVASAGRVVVIDPVTDAVTTVIDLPGVQGCSAIDYVPSKKRLYVSCGGSFRDPNQAAASALIEVDISGATPVLGRTVPASAVGGLPINFTYASVLGETALVGTLGSTDSKTHMLIAPDSFYAVDLGTMAVSKLLDASGAYNFGRVAVDATKKKVYLPDGNVTTPLVHVFDASGTTVVTAGTFEANPEAHLPAREVAWY